MTSSAPDTESELSVSLDHTVCKCLTDLRFVRISYLGLEWPGCSHWAQLWASYCLRRRNEPFGNTSCGTETDDVMAVQGCFRVSMRCGLGNNPHQSKHTCCWVRMTGSRWTFNLLFKEQIEHSKQRLQPYTSNTL